MSGVKQRKVVDYSRRELEKTTIQKNIFANQLKLKEMDNINPIFDSTTLKFKHSFINKRACESVSIYKCCCACVLVVGGEMAIYINH